MEATFGPFDRIKLKDENETEEKEVVILFYRDMVRI